MKDKPIDASDLVRIERALAGSPKGDEAIAVVRVMRDAQISAAQLARCVWDDVRPQADGSAVIVVSLSGPIERREERYLSIETMRALAPRRGLGAEPLFTKANSDGLSPAAILKRVRDAAAEAGLRGYFGGSSPALGMQRDSGSWHDRPDVRRVRTWYALGGNHWAGLLVGDPEREDDIPAWLQPLRDWRRISRHRSPDKSDASAISVAAGARLRAMLTAPPPRPGAERPTGSEWLRVGNHSIPAPPFVPHAHLALEPVRRLAREFGLPLNEVADAIERANVEVSCRKPPGRRWPFRSHAAAYLS